MAAYNVFLPGYNGPSGNEGAVQAGGLSARAVTGTLFQGVNAASAQAAQQAVQGLTGTLEQGYAHVWLASNDTTV